MANKIYDAEGIIHRIGEVKEFTERFKKQSFVLLVESEYQGKKYEDPIQFDCVNNGIQMIAYINEGFRVRVGFVIQGKEYKGDREDLQNEFFNTLKAIKVDVLEATTAQQRAANTAQADTQQAVAGFVSPQPAPAPQAAPNLGSDPDDLPF